MLRTWAFAVTVLLCLLLLGAGEDRQWPVYGQDPGGQHFSRAAQINHKTVPRLKIAWTFRTGDAYQPKHNRATAFEATPLLLDDVLYLSTPLGRTIALDPVTGQQRWAFDAHIDRDRGYGDYASRGVATWTGRAGERRIYLATIDARLIALEARTGQLRRNFGDNGIVDLRQGLRIAARRFADYEETSAPAVIGDRVIVGSGVADNGATDQPSGEVRAYHAETGKLLWSWDPIPQSRTLLGGDTWAEGSAGATGAANAWSTIMVDPERNLVFVPTGSASPDYYGGKRVGNNLFANSMVALHADTGQPAWYFQTVHHDLWDYDVAAPAILFSPRVGGERRPAVGVASKDGNLFLIDRATGRPLIPVAERNVPASDVPGEVAARSQPFPARPEGLVRQQLSADEAWGADAADREWCRGQIASLRNEGVFTPPSVRGTLVVPGNVGGAAWGGMAFDAAHNLLVLPVNNLVGEAQLIPRERYERERDSDERKLGGDWEFAPQKGTPFGMARRFLLSPKYHLPCVPPPWGEEVAIDVDTATVKWRSPVGSFPWVMAIPNASRWGSPVLGGPLITGGNLVFQAGTFDPAIYAFDIETGRMVWRGDLPTSARSSPMTYVAANGKQYVVVAAGGHGIDHGPPLGDYLVAFALAE